MHAAAGNIDKLARFTIVLAPAEQLIGSALWALAQTPSGSIKSMHTFAAVPYYSKFPQISNVNPLTSWQVPSPPDPSNILEIVTCPNNPDGEPQTPTYPNANLVHDHVYAWPSFSAADPVLVGRIKQLSSITCIMFCVVGAAAKSLAYDFQLVEDLRSAPSRTAHNTHTVTHTYTHHTHIQGLRRVEWGGPW